MLLALCATLAEAMATLYPSSAGAQVGAGRAVPEQSCGAIAARCARSVSGPARALSQTDVVRGSREALIVAACPLAALGRDLAAWTMTRTHAGAPAAGTRFAAVFLDHRMPGMGGLQTLDPLLARLPRLPPVIVLTAYASSGNATEAMRLGAFGRLTKPIRRQAVRMTVRLHPPSTHVLHA